VNLTGTSRYSPGGTSSGQQPTATASSTSPNRWPWQNPTPGTSPYVGPYSPEHYQQRDTAWNISTGTYAPQYAQNELERQQLQQQQRLAGAGYGYQQDELNLRNQQQNALLGLDRNYINQQMGFANTGWDLMRQLLNHDLWDVGLNRHGLGLDERQLDVNRNDYQRQWDVDRFNQRSDYTARGAFNSNAHRFRDENLNKQLWYAMQGFGIDKEKIDLNRWRQDTEESRIGLRHGQNDLGRDETLARLRHQLGANDVQGRYGNLLHNNATQQLGHDRALTDQGIYGQLQNNLVNQFGLNQEQAAMFGEILASMGPITQSGSNLVGSTPQQQQIIDLFTQNLVDPQR
jgi:hypothetical protein